MVKWMLLLLLLNGWMMPLLWATEKSRLGVLPFESKAGVEPGLAQTATDLLAQELVNLARYTVVERSRISQVLKEQALQQSGCTEASCAVKIGNLLNVEVMALGSMARLGKVHVVSVNLVDVERGIILSAENFSVGAVEDIIPGIKVMATRLASLARVRGSVLKIMGDDHVLVSIGAVDGAQVGQDLMVLREGTPIIQTNTGDLLSRNTQVIARGKVQHLNPDRESLVMRLAGGDAVKVGDPVDLTPPSAIGVYPKSVFSASTGNSGTGDAASRDLPGFLQKILAGMGQDLKPEPTTDPTLYPRIEALIKDRAHMKDERREDLSGLVRPLTTETRGYFYSKNKMNSFPFLMLNVVPSLGSFVQGDIVGGLLAVVGFYGGTVVFALALGSANPFHDSGMAAGVTMMVTGMGANWFGPGAYATKYNNALRSALGGEGFAGKSEVRLQVPLLSLAF